MRYMPDFSVFGLSRVINQLLPEPHAGLLAGLLFGTKASLPPEFYNALVSSGTLHIIALSGMNITIMEDLIGSILLPLVGKRAASGIAIGIIAWFVWFVGASPTILRAAIMGSISLIAVIFGRQYWALLSWTVAVVGMLVVHVSWLFDISFQLSAMATLGIILFGGKRNEERDGRCLTDCVGLSGKQASCNLHHDHCERKEARLLYAVRGDDQACRRPFISAMARYFVVFVRSFYSVVRTNFRLTLAAQVCTMPIIVFSFHRLSFVSPVANVAIGWVIAPATIVGWVAVLTGWMVLYVGQVVAWVDWILLEYLIQTIYFISRLPFAGLAW